MLEGLLALSPNPPSTYSPLCNRGAVDPAWSTLYYIQGEGVFSYRLYCMLSFLHSQLGSSI
jgi:hypothetical protein